MEHLFSPWRSRYIQSFKNEPENKSCVFCHALAGNEDARTYLVYRGKSAFVLMNLFPYNNGHLMIIPNRHTAAFESLNADEVQECQKLLVHSKLLLDGLMKPQAYNIGMNLGRSAGAGIEDHLHWHIVPRWNGDTNFMPILADTKVISEDMDRLWKTLQDKFSAFLG